MPLIRDPYSSRVRPVLEGRRGAVSAAHPLAVTAGQDMLQAGGTAVDAMIAAQAVLAVLAPDACGLGGDMLCLVRAPDGGVLAINGAGAAPLAYDGRPCEGADAITVPGIVDAWCVASARWGRLPLARVLAPAAALAREGVRVTGILAAARDAQHDRLLAGGAGSWDLMRLRAGEVFVQPRLADLLEAIARIGAAAFYRGAVAEAVVAAVGRAGGALALADLARHETVPVAPIATSWAGRRVYTQPPMAQGILLNMALKGLETADCAPGAASDHAGIELTEATFAYRGEVAKGEALLDRTLIFDPERALRRGGPRAYLHTAGVAVADAEGFVVSSLVSVFDDFGSCVFVPEAGITLNDRAGGFGAAPNEAAPGKRPVHTLAPAMIVSDRGALALATPGADGQIQTLLQVLDKIAREKTDLAAAIAAPRWRSEGGQVLIERGHPAIAALEAKGHALRLLDDGDTRFGALVAAGDIDGRPIAGADWRRQVWSGVV